MNFINKKFNKLALQGYLFAQQKCRMFTTSVHTSHLVLDPLYVTGFVDGEGSFGIYFQKRSNYRLGHQVKFEFGILLHEKDRDLLENIKLFFDGAGGIHKHGESSLKYKVTSIKDISKIIEHFDKYSLLTKKRADYLLFKRALDLINSKEHLSDEGLRKMIGIKASMNLGLTEGLKEVFPAVIPEERPLIEEPEIKDPHWLAGFVDAEGEFLNRH